MVSYYSSVIDLIDKIDLYILGRSETAEYGTSENRTTAPPSRYRLKSFTRAEKIWTPFSLQHWSLWKISNQTSGGEWNSAGYGRLEYAGASLSFPTVRYVYKTSAYSNAFETNSRYTEYEKTATSGFRFNTEVYVDLDQGCDRRVESDFNTDSY